VFVNKVLRKISGQKGEEASEEHLVFYNKTCVSYRTHSIVNPLTPNDLRRRHAVSPLNSRTTYKNVANSVLKFGGILFTRIRLTAVACYASGPLKVRLQPECTPSNS